MSGLGFGAFQALELFMDVLATRQDLNLQSPQHMPGCAAIVPQPLLTIEGIAQLSCLEPSISS